MQNIERYGLVALVFLVVTVGAVLIWNHRGKDSKSPHGAATGLVADASAPPAAQEDTGPGAPPERVLLRAEPTGRALRAGGTDATPANGGATPGATANGLDLGAAPSAPATRITEVPSATPAAPVGSDPSLLPFAPAGAAPAATLIPSDPARTTQARTPEPGRTYVVHTSDTLSEIAQRELGSAKRWPEIVALNPGLQPSRLQTGKSIRLPAKPGGEASQAQALLASASTPSKAKPAAQAKQASGKQGPTYRVASGDSLWKIAARALGDGNRWREIAELNPKVNPDRLVAGTVLTLPRGASAAPTTVAMLDKPVHAASGAGKERRVR